MEDKFTFEQFIKDVEFNAKRILSGGYLTLNNGKRIHYYISDDDSIDAETWAEQKQYVLKINKGLLKAGYEFIDRYIREYYEVAKSRNNLTEEAFIRLVAGTFSEMFFWHEYSHIVRGHFDYRDEIRRIGGDELKFSRTAEMDADIYGASFLFGKIYNVYIDKSCEYSLETLMQAYSISIRTAFEVLHRDNGFEDDFHKDSVHPHSLIRAYTAIIHGLSSPIATGLPSSLLCDCTNIALSELLSFEGTSFCTLIDVDMLNEAVNTEWDFWYQNKDQFDQYMILHVKDVPRWTKVKEFVSRLVS